MVGPSGSGDTAAATTRRPQLHPRSHPPQPIDLRDVCIVLLSGSTLGRTPQQLCLRKLTVNRSHGLREGGRAAGFSKWDEPIIQARLADRHCPTEIPPGLAKNKDRAKDLLTSGDVRDELAQCGSPTKG